MPVVDERGTLVGVVSDFDIIGKSGRTVVLTMDFPGPTLFDGNGTGRIYVDDGATAEQRGEFESIFQGKSGGAPAAPLAKSRTVSLVLM